MSQKTDYILSEYHRDVSDKELIEDIQRTAQKINTVSLTTKQYQLNGKYHWSTICRRFGGWNSALDIAGLLHAKNYSRKKVNTEVSDKELIDDLIIVSKTLAKDSITTTEYDTFGHHGYKFLIYRFSTWDNALHLAGLKSTGFHHAISDDDLFAEIARLWSELGRQPTSTDIRNGASKYSLNTYTRRFGGWRNALKHFIAWVSECDERASGTSQHGAQIISPGLASGSVKESPSVAKRRTSRDVNYRMRFKIMQRDNFRCCACGASPAKDPNVELHIDHIVPWSKGGETTIDNLQTLCSKCNLGKSDEE